MNFEYYDLKDILEHEIASLIALILDFFSDSTGWVIAIYDAQGNSRWCKCNDRFSPLCNYLNQDPKLWRLCEEDHAYRTSKNYFSNTTENKLAMCHLGLWNISHPIYLGNTFYGALITGQKRLLSQEKTQESSIRLEETLASLRSDSIITSNTEKDIKRYVSQVPVIKEFPTDLLSKLADIDRKLIELIQNVMQRVDRRLKRLTLLRHELHQPNITVRSTLLKIIRLTEELRNRLSDDKIAVSQLDEIIDNLRYSRNTTLLFSTIIENISSSLNRDVLKPNIRRENIVRILEDAMTVFEAPAKIKDVELKPMKMDGIWIKYIEIDRSLIMRAFTNIYQNAVKYSYYGQKNSDLRTVNTRYQLTDTYFRIEISNYGTGILEQELKEGTIWQEGVRGKLSSDRHRTGSGLGLSQIKQIIEAHNGKVQLKSVPVSDDPITGPYLTTIIVDIPYYYQSPEETK